MGRQIAISSTIMTSILTASMIPATMTGEDRDDPGDGTGPSVGIATRTRTRTKKPSF